MFQSHNNHLLNKVADLYRFLAVVLDNSTAALMNGEPPPKAGANSTAASPLAQHAILSPQP
jgi:hypothetical protein